ncbi:MAG: substrate-binding periplasmic protein [Hyphomicrobiaceae bacterium]
MLETLIKERVFAVLLGGAAFAMFVIALVSGFPRLKDGASIRIAAPLLPPQMTLQGEGREAEIILAAFKAAGVGKPVEFHIMPFTRHWQAFLSDQRLDGVTTVPQDIQIKGIRSETYIHYQNGIFYRLADFPRGLAGEALTRIAAKRIVAFAGSTSVLPQVREVSDKARLYIERADQLSHSVMLQTGFVDVVIADELIFNFYTRELLGDGFQTYARTLAFDPVFCPTPYQMVFRDYELRQAFNAGMAVIARNGELDRINRKYALAGAIARRGSLPGVCGR